MKGFETKPTKRLNDKEVKAVVLAAVNALTLEGKSITIVKVVNRCSGAGRSRFRNALSELIRSGQLLERSRP